jgi:hypothetical protein
VSQLLSVLTGGARARQQWVTTRESTLEGVHASGSMDVFLRALSRRHRSGLAPTCGGLVEPAHVSLAR